MSNPAACAPMQWPMRLRTYDDDRAVLQLGSQLELALLLYLDPLGSHAVWMLGGSLLAWVDVGRC